MPRPPKDAPPLDPRLSAMGFDEAMRRAVLAKPPAKKKSRPKKGRE